MKRATKEQPVVCGTDFSGNAKEAVDIAAAIARKLGTELILLHVDEFGGLAEVDPKLFDVTISRKKGDLARETARLRKAGTTIEEKLRSGSAFDELVEEAVEAEAQLLVVGAVGHGLTRRFFVGSVAERTAEASPIPTLVIRPGSRLGSWLAGRHPLKVLLGYDFSAASDAALQWVHRLQSMGSCEIRVVHVDWPPDEASRLGYQGPLPLARNPQEIQSALERDLVERVKMFLPNDQVTIEVHPGWGHPEGSLFDIANRQQVDLVVVGTNRRHGLGRLRFGSVSRAVLHHATVPVAVVPPPSRPDRGVIPKFERVLAVTDFSPLGNRAIPYARALLHRGGTLKLIHVLESSARAGTARKAPAEKEHQKILGSLRALLPKEEAADIHLEVEVLAGKEVARTIQQESERFHADAICLGSHGRSGLARTVLGSIAQEVISGSRRPVLVVRS